MEKSAKLLMAIGFFFLLCGSSQGQVPQTLKADVAVIGAGASGLVAALTAAGGGVRVMIFEKMVYAGGTSNYAGGIFAVESEMQRRRNIRISRDEAFQMIME